MPLDLFFGRAFTLEKAHADAIGMGSVIGFHPLPREIRG